VTQHSAEAALPDAQFEDLFDAAQDLDPPFDAECTFILIAGGRLGLRAGEIAHINEKWIDWDRSLIEIPAYWPCTKGEDGGVCGDCKQQAEQNAQFHEEKTAEDLIEERWKPKTSNSARAVPFDFNDRVETVVRAFFAEFDEYQHSRSSINRRVNRVLEAAGYPTDKCWPHALRATAATWNAYRGVPATALQSLFGWSDLATARKYIRLSGGATQKALKDAHGDD
jgi:integrase